MNALLKLILAHPEWFDRSEVPCPLLGCWEIAFEEWLATQAKKAIVQARALLAA